MISPSGKKYTGCLIAGDMLVENDTSSISQSVGRGNALLYSSGDAVTIKEHWVWKPCSYAYGLRGVLEEPEKGSESPLEIDVDYVVIGSPHLTAELRRS